MKSFHRKAAAFLSAAAILAGVHSRTAQAVASSQDLAKRVADARAVYQELAQSPDRGVPQKLQSDCKCIGVFPHVVKAAIGIGGRYGTGVVSCRDAAGKWSPLAFFKMTGGSWGLQLGAQSTDIVLYFMSEKSARSLLQSKFTLGGNASVAAGPVGRSAEASTDLKLNAEIYSYARSKGLFAGISLEGARLASDKAANRDYYGSPVSAKAILFDHGVRAKQGETLLSVLP